MRALGPDPDRKIKVLIIDDSPYVRRTIRTMLQTTDNIEVVGFAGDGDEGLKMVEECDPDVITLDLEMPRLDGFSFLRILMRHRPRPVVVVSSLTSRENVLKALELGALDFVAKPEKSASPALGEIRADLVAKVQAGANSLVEQLKRRLYTTRELTAFQSQKKRAEVPKDPSKRPVARGLVVIGTSTGGPTSLRTLLTKLPPSFDQGIIVAIHMPPRFTRAFAARLDKGSNLSVREAESGHVVRAGEVLIAPGGVHTELRRSPKGYQIQLTEPTRADRYVPSVDRLFVSAAEAAGPRAVAVILTGMGSDGAMGAQYFRLHGGVVLAEHESTAVVYGMPREAIATGHVNRVLPLEDIPIEIELLSRR